MSDGCPSPMSFGASNLLRVAQTPGVRMVCSCLQGAHSLTWETKGTIVIQPNIYNRSKHGDMVSEPLLSLATEILDK